MSNFGKDNQDFLFPVTPKEEIDRCLNCTKAECTGSCGSYVRGGRTAPLPRALKYKRNRVICLDTGQIFDDVRAASRAAGRSASSIKACLNGVTQSCAGLRWAYAPAAPGEEGRG